MCSCDICERSRVFRKHLKTVKDEKAKRWFEDIFNHLLEVEEDLCYMDIVKKNLHGLYPEIYKEVFTARDLTNTTESKKKVNI